MKIYVKRLGSSDEYYLSLNTVLHWQSDDCYLRIGPDITPGLYDTAPTFFPEKEQAFNAAIAMGYEPVEYGK